MTPPPTNIDGTDITGATIDGQDVQEITIDGQTAFTAVPASLIHKYSALEQTEGDGVTVNPWKDNTASLNLDAIGSPSMDKASLNGVDAINLDGSNDAYDYKPNLSGTIDEPVTFIFSLDVQSFNPDFSTLFRDNVNGLNEVLFRSRDNQYQCVFGGSNFFGDQLISGQQILSFRVSNGDGVDLRANGTEVVSAASSNVSPGDAVLSDSDGGDFFKGFGTDRFLDALVSEIEIHDQRLSDSDLAAREQVLETNAGMSVLP